MSVLERLRAWNDGWTNPQTEIARGGYSAPMSWDSFQQWFTYNNNVYPFGISQTITGKSEQISPDYGSLAAGAYRGNAVIFACMSVRAMLFSEARFQFRGRSDGRPTGLFGKPQLSVLEQPMPGQTTGDLLTRAIQDADLAGNWFGLRDGDRIRRLRPDWVSIVLGSRMDAEEAGEQLDAEIIGYLYHPGGYSYDDEPIPLDRSQVAHFAPNPDPLARFRGMSWLTPVVREVMADNAARDHKLKFFENGATSNMVVKVPDSVRKEMFEEWVDKFKGQHEGLASAYRTIYLGAGADVTVVGADFKQMDFKITQGAGETRIAAAAGVPPVIVGLSEGLDAATYSNYAQARRRFSDGTMRPLWRMMAGALAQIVPAPPGSELWFDDRDISFLQEDLKDTAEIQVSQASAAKQAIDAGYDPDSVIAWLASDDITLLSHTGLVSVQLQEPGAQNQNGSGSPDAIPAPTG